MTQQNLQQRRTESNRNARTERPTGGVSRARVEEMLREIAFVLKMTQQVRKEIDAGAETREPALV